MSPQRAVVARGMRDDDRDTLAEHGRQLTDLQHVVGELRSEVADHGRRLERIEHDVGALLLLSREHGERLDGIESMIRTIMRHLGIGESSS